MDQIRGTHPYHFRSGKWAELVGAEIHQTPSGEMDPCYLVKFADGRTDYWSVNDKDAGYEFRTVPDVDYDHDTAVREVIELLAAYYRSFASRHVSANISPSDLNILADRAGWFLSGHGLLRLGEQQ